MRQLGKRNPALHKQAITMAEELRRQPSRSAAWIAADALRELKKKFT